MQKGSGMVTRHSDRDPNPGHRLEAKASQGPGPQGQEKMEGFKCGIMCVMPGHIRACGSLLHEGKILSPPEAPFGDLKAKSCIISACCKDARKPLSISAWHFPKRCLHGVQLLHPI